VADFAISEKSTDSGCTVLGLLGELDLAGAPTMRAAGLAALAEPDCSTLVLDVTAVAFVDSTGLGSWVELRKHAKENDQRLVLRGVSENLKRVLTIAGLVSLFDVEPAPPDDDPA
jgi:anti-sigma B factor antagonist